MNGDGFDDLLIGAPQNHQWNSETSGKTYLILGKTTGWHKSASLSEADASFLGETGGDGAVYSVSSAGDVNGDGQSDLLIGSRRNDEGGQQAGQTYLILFTSLALPKS